MKMYEFENHNNHAVRVVGPNREIIRVPARGSPKSKIILSEFFVKYCPKYLRVVRIVSEDSAIPTVRQQPAKLQLGQNRPSPSKRRSISSRKTRPRPVTKSKPLIRTAKGSTGGIVGKVTGRNEAATKRFRNLVEQSGHGFVFSSNIGVGILSYNRIGCIKRLLDSIRANTDVEKVTIFVSDESDNSEVKDYLQKQDWIVLLDNDKRLGIAGNSNRLLRCLERFEHKILLNDDVEILAPNWENFYADAMKATNYHHFCYRETGIYGAQRGSVSQKFDGFDVETVQEKPHGAVMAFNSKAFNTVGYFDMSFGPYGMEHVDWSRRLWLSGIQKPGYHDISGSNRYFKIHNDKSSVSSKSGFSEAKKKFEGYKNDKSRIYIKPDDLSVVPAITYVIPYRSGQDRGVAVEAVVSNVRAQQFPRIEIIVVEEDQNQQLSPGKFWPSKHMFVKGGVDFCKAAAFNAGVFNAGCGRVVMHDADILIPRSYTTKVHKLLDVFASCHIGRHVIYMSRGSTQKILQSDNIDPKMECDRIVGYFEGGSLACRKKTFMQLGGFCEEFKGYGNEDCEFFERLHECTKMYNERTVDLIHLWHGRTGGWGSKHRINGAIHKRLTRIGMDKRLERVQSAFARKYK